MKVCTKCKESKSLNNFYKKVDQKDGYHYTCKNCLSKVNLNYYWNNKDKVTNKQKEWYLKNKKVHSLRVIEYQKKNPQIVKKASKKWNNKNREYFRNWTKNKYYNDPNFKIRKILSVRLSDLLKNKNINKSFSILELIDCSLDFLINYFEKQFYSEMSWENHGKVWEIDHIIPCASFDLTKIENQQKCFHYSNLQPLFKTTEIAENFGYNNIIGNRNKLNK